MSQVKKVLIIGGGIGGLSAAIALRNKGIAVDVVEIKKENPVYHVGIIVQSNFIRAMQALGIDKEAVAAGFPYETINLCDINGNVIADTGKKSMVPGYLPNLGMARPAMHNVLYSAAKERGAHLREGLTFSNIDDRGDSVFVDFTDGSSGEYDVVIGADGLYSKVRALLFGADKVPVYSGQSVWRYNLPRPASINNGYMYDGQNGGKAGVIPLTEDTMYILLVHRLEGNTRLPADTLAASFRERLEPYGGLLAEYRDFITESSQVVYRPLEVLIMPRPWYKGRVVMLGDAVHAATPHLGQGAAQAVEDAVVLGEVLAKGRPIDSLFEEYMDLRYERCKLVGESSIQLGQWEQDEDPDADWINLTQKVITSLHEPIF